MLIKQLIINHRKRPIVITIFKLIDVNGLYYFSLINIIGPLLAVNKFTGLNQNILLSPFPLLYDKIK